jgi:hypothetical protein
VNRNHLPPATTQIDILSICANALSALACSAPSAIKPDNASYGAGGFAAGFTVRSRLLLHASATPDVVVTSPILNLDDCRSSRAYRLP